MNKNQQAQALLTLFIGLYEDKYGVKPTLNRYRLKWGAVDFIDSVGYTEAKAIVEYYMTVSTNHSFEYLLQSFDKIDTMRKERNSDDERRARLREETRRRVEEYERRSISD
jgi:hypothetical protein